MLLIADNLQIIQPAIAQAVQQLDPAPIQRLVRQCVSAGAQAIDINSGPLSRRPERYMAFLVEAVQSVTDLPILLDTTNPRAIAAGLQQARGQVIINGFSLETSRLETVLPLAAAHDVDIVGYLLYPNGQVPLDAAERMKIALELWTVAGQAGLDENRLIIDPIIAPVMWDNGIEQDLQILSVLRDLPDLLGFPVRTIAGISNLTSGRGPTAKKRLLEQAYLPMLAAAGLNMALLNIFHDRSVAIAGACQALTSGRIFTWQEI